MTKEQVETGKRRRARFYLLTLVIPVVLLILFFGAPVLPVAYSAIARVAGCASVPYTDWQSPGYYLFKIGYHYSTPHIFC